MMEYAESPHMCLLAGVATTLLVAGPLLVRHCWLALLAPQQLSSTPAPDPDDNPQTTTGEVANLISCDKTKLLKEQNWIAQSVPGMDVGILEKARALKPPAAVKLTGGEMEGTEFWAQNEKLLEQAWLTYGRGDERVYRLGTHALHPNIVRAVTAKDHASLMACVQETIPGVYTFPLLNTGFCKALMEEIERLQLSGIPLRRPNGMNRYGAILSELGFGELLKSLSDVVMPIACELFSDWIAPQECSEQYGFTVRYKVGEDLSLAEHFDTSNLTLNVCLGKQFTGGDLYFKGIRYTENADSEEKQQVQHKPGWALLHLGGHKHAALPIESGERCNLILWCVGDGGIVRIVPYPARKKMLI